MFHIVYAHLSLRRTRVTVTRGLQERFIFINYVKFKNKIKLKKNENKKLQDL